MPIRSSVCTYSPSTVTDSKYSTVLPSTNLLSVRNYKSPSSSSSTYGLKSSSMVQTRGSSGADLLSPSSSSSYRTPNRYSTSSNTSSSSSSSTSYSPSSYTSTGGYSSPTSSTLNYASITGSYRPLKSTNSSLANSISRHHHTNTLGSSGSPGNSTYSRYSSTSSLASNSAASYLNRCDTLTSLNSNLPYSSILSSKRHSLTSSSSAETLPSEVPRGLVNLGNTCYMNAVIQSLYSIDSFRNLILRSSHMSSLGSELSSVFRELKRASGPVSPTSFKQVFSRHQSKFLGLGQQDAQEFLRYLINELHEEMNHPRRSSVSTETPKTADQAWSLYRDKVDDSPMVDLVVGQMCSTIVCSVCQHKSHCWDPFWDLSLPLSRGRRSCSLDDVIQDFTARETLDSNEKPMCSSCKKPTRSTKQISLCRLPQLLILHLKKFTNDGYKMTSPDVRITESLSFNDNTSFTLVACISHHGHSSSSGHYTCHCKYSSRWYHFNDDRIRDVTNTFQSEKLNDAYVLFYTRSSNVDSIAHSKL